MLLACGGDDPSAVDDGTDTDMVTGSGSTSTESSSSSDDGCAGQETECDGECVNTRSDPQHCGGCDQPCDAAQACIDGACSTACEDAGTSLCDGTCVDLDDDPEHCGDCDTACPPTATCTAGECTCPDAALVCATACADPLLDEQNCGGCDQPCEAGQPCLDGSCVTATVHHILITGQSLSEGVASNVVTTEQPYDNLMFVTGVRAGGTGLDAFVPLIETASGDGRGETIASGSANLLHELIEPQGLAMRVLASVHGVSGQPYSALMKGTVAYANGMAQVAAGASLSTAMGDTSAVRAVAVIHGETDHINGNALYDQNLLQWQLDYETDVQAATGQTLPVPMFYCQMSSFTAYGSSSSAIPLLQLAARDARPDRMIVVGPKYFLPYSDGVHLTGDGERWLGQYYAKAFARVLVDGLPWLPLQPVTVTREGAVITIAFDVPVPPLVLDETSVSNPGNYGFVYADDSGAPPAIASVELVDDVTVAVTLAAEPVGPNGRIRYALDGIGGQPAGAMTGARGNLRDSDATTSRFAYPLYNWAVHFEAAVP